MVSHPQKHAQNVLAEGSNMNERSRSKCLVIVLYQHFWVYCTGLSLLVTKNGIKTDEFGQQ